MHACSSTRILAHQAPSDAPHTALQAVRWPRMQRPRSRGARGRQPLQTPSCGPAATGEAATRIEMARKVGARAAERAVAHRSLHPSHHAGGSDAGSCACDRGARAMACKKVRSAARRSAERRALGEVRCVPDGMARTMRRTFLHHHAAQRCPQMPHWWALVVGIQLAICRKICAAPARARWKSTLPHAHHTATV